MRGLRAITLLPIWSEPVDVVLEVPGARFAASFLRRAAMIKSRYLKVLETQILLHCRKIQGCRHDNNAFARILQHGNQRCRSMSVCILLSCTPYKLIVRYLRSPYLKATSLGIEVICCNSISRDPVGWLSASCSPISSLRTFLCAELSRAWEGWNLDFVQSKAKTSNDYPDTIRASFPMPALAATRRRRGGLFIQHRPSLVRFRIKP